MQLASGLAAAHDQGIAHRDLKPENIIVTKDGRLKILDFGLAKLRRSHAQTETVDGVTAAETNVGMVLGTAGYMSPEQVRGEPADHAFGYFQFRKYFVRNAERATRVQAEHQRRDHDRDSERRAAGTCPRRSACNAAGDWNESCGTAWKSSRGSVSSRRAILRSIWNRFRRLPEPARRQRAEESPAARVDSPGDAGDGRTRCRIIVLGCWLHPSAPETQPKLHRVTFSRLTILSARFTPDGNLIYGASLESRASGTFFCAERQRGVAADWNALRPTFLAVAPNGELAVQSNPVLTQGFALCRDAGAGAADRRSATRDRRRPWSMPTGLLTVRWRWCGESAEKFVWNILWARFSTKRRAGSAIRAFRRTDRRWRLSTIHIARDDAGSVAVIDKSGQKKTLTTLNFVSAQGLAWHPAAKRNLVQRNNLRIEPGAIRGVAWEQGTAGLSGNRNAYAARYFQGAGEFLFSRDDWRSGIIGLGPGATKERDLSWHDWTIGRDITDDGKTGRLRRNRRSGEETGAFYVRGTDGSPAVRLGNGVVAAH